MGGPAVIARGPVRLAAAARRQGADGRGDAGRRAGRSRLGPVRGRDSRVTRIRLGDLSPADLIELAAALGLGMLSQRGASRLAAHTEGNALYCPALLEEVGIAALCAGAGGLPAPRDLSAVILARAATMSRMPGSRLESGLSSSSMRSTWRERTRQPTRHEFQRLVAQIEHPSVIRATW